MPRLNPGWTAYAPLQSGSTSVIGFSGLPRDGLLPFENLLVWFGLVLGWFAGSALLLRRARPRAPVEPAAVRGGEGVPVDAGTAPTGD